MTEPPLARRPIVGVMGGAECGSEEAALAEEVGRLLARRHAILLSGGRGGVMEAASRGAAAEGGLVLGLLPGRDAAESPPNAHLSVALFTGLGDGRNYVNACASHALIAIAGGWGTLSEIALARKLGKSVVLLRGWVLDAPDLIRASTAEDAVEEALLSIA